MRWCRPPASEGTIPTIDEVVASVMYLPHHLRARRLRDRLERQVRHSLVQHQSAMSTAARRGLQLWNTMAVIPTAPVPARCRRGGARIMVGGSRPFNCAPGARSTTDAGPSEPLAPLGDRRHWLQ